MLKERQTAGQPVMKCMLLRMRLTPSHTVLPRVLLVQVLAMTYINMPTCFLYSWWRPDFLFALHAMYRFQISKRPFVISFYSPHFLFIIPSTFSSLSIFGFFLTTSFFLSACALWRQAYNQIDFRCDSKFGVLLGNLVRVHFARLCRDVMIFLFKTH